VNAEKRLELARAQVRQIGVTDFHALSEETGVDTGDESVVQQQFREETDVNTIMRRFGVTGSAPAPVPGAMYVDLTDISDFDSVSDVVDRARAGFAVLPAEVRESFRNDPNELAKFVSQASYRELQERGFVVPGLPVPEVPAPQGSPAAAPSPAE